MVYTGEDYDDIREGDPHFKTMEEDINRLTPAQLPGEIRI